MLLMTDYTIGLSIVVVIVVLIAVYVMTVPYQCPKCESKDYTWQEDGSVKCKKCNEIF